MVSIFCTFLTMYFVVMKTLKNQLKKDLTLWAGIISVFSSAFSLYAVEQQDNQNLCDNPPQSGTFYLLSAQTLGIPAPPYPCNPYPDDWRIPVYSQGDNTYLIADTPEDAAELISSATPFAWRSGGMRSLSNGLPPLPGGSTNTNSGSYQITFPELNTNGLWMEVFLDNMSNLVAVVHNMEIGGNYYIQSSTVADPPFWNFDYDFIATSNTMQLVANMGYYQSQSDSYFFRVVDFSPVAEPDYFMVQQDSQENLLDVLRNDHSPNDVNIFVLECSAPSYGDLDSISWYVEEGIPVSVPFSLFYTPDLGYYGIDSFEYQIESIYGGSAYGNATVFVNKTGNNSPQQEIPLAFTLQTNTYSVTFNVLTNITDMDGDPVSLYAVTAPQYGTVAYGSEGTVTYERDPRYYGNDYFDYIVTDGKGGLLKAQITIEQVKGENDPRIPCQWLLDYGFNLSATNSLTDADEDGVNNLAEFMLGTHPRLPDNPLNLSFITNGTVLSGCQYSPVVGLNKTVQQYRTSVDLLVDGALSESTFLTQDIDGLWVLKWDTSSVTNGNHAIQMCVRYGSEETDVIVGEQKSVYTSNLFMFNPIADYFSSVLNIDAVIADTNTVTNYTVALYDEYYNLLIQDVFTVTNKHLWIKWDLCDTNGIQLTHGGIIAKIYPSTNQLDPDQAITKVYQKEGRIKFPNVFTVAWGWDSYGKSFVNQRTSLMRDGVINCLNSADLGIPYTVLPSLNAQNISTAFRYDTEEDKYTLTNALIQSSNFFWFGHGIEHGGITGNKARSILDSAEIGKILSNKNLAAEFMESTTKLELNNNPYKLVVLNSCYSYDKFMCAAFGIDYDKNGSNRTVDDYVERFREPRAFVGWEGEITVPTEAWGSSLVSAYYTFALSQFWSDWMQGKPLYECLDKFDGYIRGYTIFSGMTKWKISGCWDLRRYN